MSMPNLLDIAKANKSDRVVGLIEEATKVHPEMTVLPSRQIKGMNYKTLVRTALGATGGSFRNANEGTASIKSVYENRLVEVFILEARIEADKAVADSYEDGAEAYLAIEGAGIVEGEMQGVCKQFYYGTSGNSAKGFPGLMDAVAAAMTIDATGSTANTGSSVWFVRSGIQDVIWCWGNGGKIEVPQPRIADIIDPNDSTKRLTGYVSSLLAYPGLQVGSTQSIARIKNLTAQAGKGLTDILVNQALATFPAGKGPDTCFMSQRSLQQLQSSRTATSATGAPAPWPTAIVGADGKEIPIKVTDAIVNTEAIA